MHIHICVVSGQVLPNLIPVLQESPDRVVLLSSAKMSERVEPLARPIRAQGIPVTVRNDLPDHGLEAIYEYALRLQEDLARDYADAEITLNVTGGNKLIALGLYNFCQDYRVFYTDTDHRRIEILPAPGKKPDEIPMDNVLTVRTYLEAQGFQCRRIRSRSEEWVEKALQRKGLCKRLAEKAAAIGNFIGSLNKCAYLALDNTGTALKQPEQDLHWTPRGDAAEILEELNQRDFLAWTPGTGAIVFRDPETTRFLSGLWLEEYVYHILKDNGVFDVALGVEGQWLHGRGGKNEFDVLATHGNQLLFVECKTLTHQYERDSDIAYKLEALGRDAGGLHGLSWLVTARTPTDNLLDHARRAHFEVIGPDTLGKLRKRVRAWVTETL
jgi:hypothetical protein